jgi:hypothetical protein
LRKEINVFYIELDKNVTESLNTVGQINPNVANNHDIQIITNFTNIAIQGADIKTKVSKYRVLWFNSK